MNKDEFKLYMQKQSQWFRDNTDTAMLTIEELNRLAIEYRENYERKNKPLDPW